MAQLDSTKKIETNFDYIYDDGSKITLEYTDVLTGGDNQSKYLFFQLNESIKRDE